VLLHNEPGVRLVAKLTDFGLAVAAPDDTVAGGWLTAETGTYRWMAPEVICHERYSKCADVFSFGCVLFELLCHEVPFADRPALQAAVAVGLNDERPTLPEGVPLPLSQLVYACWTRVATERPSFFTIAASFAMLPEQLSADEHRWLDAPCGHPVYGTHDGTYEPPALGVPTAMDVTPAPPRLRPPGAGSFLRRSSRSAEDGSPHSSKSASPSFIRSSKVGSKRPSFSRRASREDEASTNPKNCVLS